MQWLENHNGIVFGATETYLCILSNGELHRSVSSELIWPDADYSHFTGRPESICFAMKHSIISLR